MYGSGGIGDPTSVTDASNVAIGATGLVGVAALGGAAAVKHVKYGGRGEAHSAFADGVVAVVKPALNAEDSSSPASFQIFVYDDKSPEPDGIWDGRPYYLSKTH